MEPDKTIKTVWFNARLCLGKVLLPLGVSACLMASFPSQAMSIDSQRAQYQSAIAAIEKNRVSEFKKLKSKLGSYPLYPYLDYRSFTRDLTSADYPDIVAFEERYADLPFINSLRARYLSLLAQRKDWKGLLEYQTTVPRGEYYQCHYYYAHSRAGDKALALSGAKSLYLSGSSVDSACDPLFRYLKKEGKLTNDLILERMLLSFDKRNSGLMGYLSKQLTGYAKTQGDAVKTLYKRPDTVAAFSKKSKVTSFNRRLTRQAFERLARKDAAAAVKQFDRTVQGQHYSEHERQEIADFLASRLMSTDNPKLAMWRDKALSQTVNQSLLERRIRHALGGGNWQEVSYWLGRLSEKEAARLKWKYWRARVAMEVGDTETANRLFGDMVGLRNFYSVAAASQIGTPITIPAQSPPLEKNAIVEFTGALRRVDELVTLDKLAAAKREWQYMLAGASSHQKAMLAAYASKKGWHHLSVQATISGKLWDHLEYRFPVAHRWWFDFFSKERQLPLTTLLALSRQESAFYSGAVSPVGARGLMQLMPATAKETSEKLGFRYKGKNSLSEPGTNIRLGSGYLKMLLDRYDDNRVLAFAAYNAGPHRVSRWLDNSDGNLDAIAFIEAIPFRETRGYVQNVLMYEMYYRELLGEPQRFLQSSESERRY